MSVIRDEYVLTDKVSDKLSKMVLSFTQLEQAARTGETALTQAARSQETFAAASEQSQQTVSAATQELIDRLAPLQDAISNAYTNNQAEAALNNLMKQMSRFGLVATSSGAEADLAYELTKRSLQDMADGGVIAANSLAESSYKAAQAAEQEREAAQKAADFSKSEDLISKLAEKSAAQQMAAERAAQDAEAQQRAAEAAAAEAQQQEALAAAINLTTQAAEQASAVAGTCAGASYAAAEAEKQREAAVRAAANGDVIAAQQAVQASEEMVAAAEQAAAAHERHAERVHKLTSAFANAAGGVKSFISSMLGLDKASTPIDSITHKLARMALSFFTVRKLIRYVTQGMARAPDEIAKPFETLKKNISDNFARAIVSAMDGMKRGVDRLNAALNTEGGQKMLRGIETAARIAGEVIGFLFDKIALLVEWVGNNFQTVMTVAAVALALYTGHMLAAAAATMAANLPLYALIALAAAFVVGMQQAGITSEEILTKIGEGFGLLYSTVYNLFVDAHNLIASFAEFFANVFDDPLAAVAHLFIDVFDTIVGVVETAAEAIDALTGSNLVAAVSGFRDQLQSWADNTFGEKKITIERMTKMDAKSTMTQFGEKAASVGTMFSNASLELTNSQNIKATADNTKAIKKAVAMSEEDLKSLVDVAERQYVNQINLTAQTPIITVNGANTGNTPEDRQQLANAIRDILIEQAASGSVRSTAYAYST